ncbi:glycoside hydrolase family protein [Puniceicoccus vermicola]|uniref:Glycosyl hydrolase family 43 n=1 Tax=Puniceicoccus vermicola TaxID=388746 RepID=A0A7X1B0N0_9BACT|nr:glycoside hydrolase family protein [Puniceicoccus vermicola]MBC2603446.1 glycosyl hydrolase family 43 [Puniceicoccus vermicola]
MFTDIALAGRGLEFWDACTVHNPTIHRVADQYALFYMANRFEPCADREQAIRSKRIGVALSNSLYGPWKRMDFPLIDAGSPDSWDEILVSNPSFVEDRNGSFKLYYKGVDRISWEKSHGNRKYGVATAGKLEGPYTKYAANPIIDLSVYGESYECEDAFIWQDVEGYHAIMRDMGLFGDRYGIYMRSHDGIAWGDPQVGYRPSTSYTREPPNGLSREGRFERPQILFRDSKPTHLFVAFRGGESLGSTAAVLEIRNSDSDE